MKIRLMMLGGAAAMMLSATPVLAADPMNSTQNEAQVNKTDDASTAMGKPKAAPQQDNMKVANSSPYSAHRHHHLMRKMAMKSRSKMRSEDRDEMQKTADLNKQQLDKSNGMAANATMMPSDKVTAQPASMQNTTTAPR